MARIISTAVSQAAMALLRGLVMRGRMPKNASMASPSNLFTTPPWLTTMGTSLPKYSFSQVNTLEGSACSDRVVKARMSVISTLETAS